ncbi:hypothetical protein GQ457_14G001660 [Hibiscus cannabinus]
MDSRREIPKCNRELDVDLRTSWNNANPGRRIFDCSKYGVGRNCNFFIKMKEGRKKRTNVLDCLFGYVCVDIMGFYVVLIRVLDFDLGILGNFYGFMRINGFRSSKTCGKLLFRVNLRFCLSIFLFGYVFVD